MSKEVRAYDKLRQYVDKCDSVMWSVDIFFDLHVDKLLSKQSWRQWLDTIALNMTSL